MNEVLKTYKGFDKNLRCRDFQYEVGKEYEEPEALACRRGFHACERPLDVFAYYSPAGSRFCEVEQSGEVSRDTDDTKVASTKIKIGAEIGIPGLVKAQIEWVKAHTTMEHTDPEKATAGEYGAATSRGASAAGENGLAVARGNDVKVKGGLGAILVIAEENPNNFNIKDWVAVQVDGTNVKADTWYKLKNGQLEEVPDNE